MFYAGIDVHVKSSTICVVDRRGRKVHGCEVLTSAEGFEAGLGKWARRGLMAAVESGRITAWVCELLKALKVKVVVVNANRVRLIAESRKKADRVDAETLAELLRLGGLPEVHQASAEARRLRSELGVRRQLVAQRTALANKVRGLRRAWGVNLPARFLGRKGSWMQLAGKESPEYIRGLLQTLEGVYEQLTRAIRELGCRLESAAGEDDRVERLRSIPGVGPLSALTLVSAVDDVRRFGRAKQLTVESCPPCGPAESVNGRVPSCVKDAVKCGRCGFRRRMPWRRVVGPPPSLCSAGLGAWRGAEAFARRSWGWRERC